MIFTSKDIRTIMGMQRGRLEEWVERGYLVPSIHKSTSRGTPHVWSQVDFYNISVFNALAEIGLPWRVTNRLIAKGILGQDDPIDTIGFIIFAREGEHIEARAIAYKEDDRLELDLENLLTDMDMYKRDRQFDNLFVLNFAKIKREVDENSKIYFDAKLSR